MTTEPKSPLTYGLARYLPADVRGPAEQNPAPFVPAGQVDLGRVRALADAIVRVYMNSLPSNYVAESRGPYYVQQFQAAAEALARVQLLAYDAYGDSDWDFTRPQVLWQFLGTLVFPDAAVTGLPAVDGDLTYREFLRRMAALLLQGSTTATLQQGVQALAGEATAVTVIAKGPWVGQPGVAWTWADRFAYEVFVGRTPRTAPTVAPGVVAHSHSVEVDSVGAGLTGEATAGPAHQHAIAEWAVVEANGTGQVPHVHALLSAPADSALTLERDAALVLGALDPAHTLYQYHNLFREDMRNLYVDSLVRTDYADYLYDDLRRDYGGLKSIAGSAGQVLTDRYLFGDPERDFGAVQPPATLTVMGGPSAGSYGVRGVAVYPYGDDPLPRPYTTSPTGLTGTVTVEGGALVDAAQDWALAVADELLTIASGPNAGTYRLATLVGEHGGPLGSPVATGPATRVLPAPSLLRLDRRAPAVGGPYAYTVGVDRLGTQAITTLTEDVSEQFWTPGGPYSTFQVARGPVVKADGTLANARSLTVTYDGTPLTVDLLNPYTGQVTLAAPVVGFAPGAHTVTVTYSWTPNPTVGLVGLNTLGLVLNKWDRRGPRRTASTVGVGLPGGGTDPSRFAYNVGLGAAAPRHRQPQRIAHRFVAYEQGYTAGLNSPTTLLLNQYPGRVSTPYAYADAQVVAVDYRGAAVPEDPWTARGVPRGTVNAGEYTLTDSDPQKVGYWQRDFDLPIASTVAVAARFRVGAYAPAGAFTGVAFGFHNNQRLYLAGALAVPVAGGAGSMRHLGLLVRPGDPNDLSSWLVGPYTEAALVGAAGTSTVRVTTAALPTLIAVGSRAQVIAGSQAGVYTVTDYLRDGLDTLVEFSPAFPADPALWGNGTVVLTWEVPWDADGTWQLQANTRTLAASVSYGGALAGSMSLGGYVAASPAALSPDLIPDGAGRLVWGSFSRAATNVSTWQLVAARAQPDGAAQYARGTVIDAQPGAPDDAEWYALSPWGTTATAGSTQQLTALAGSAVGGPYGYGYVDPYLDGRRVVALEATVTLTRDTYGAGGAALLLDDGHRRAMLCSLFCVSGPGGNSILVSPTLTLLGPVAPELQGWTATAGSPAWTSAGPYAVVESTGTDAWAYGAALGAALTAGRYCWFRLQVDSHVAGTGGAMGLYFVCKMGGRSVAVSFADADTIVLSDGPGGGAVNIVTYPWADGAAHTYGLTYDVALDRVQFTVDGVPSANPLRTDFALWSGGGDARVLYAPAGTPAFAVRLYGYSYGATHEGIAGAVRTFGLYVGDGTDPANLDSYVVPRSDGFPVPNSDPAATLVPMDWRSPAWVRVFVDPVYGASFLRPDLAPPPGYSGDFATQSMDPSAGWCGVEYARLPRSQALRPFGVVEWGALNGLTTASATWEGLRYRVFTNTSLDYRAPQRMVLNQASVVTSGDYLLDTTPEVVTVEAVTPTRVSLRPLHIYANRVFAVAVGSAPLPPGAWSFDVASQVVLLAVPVARGTPVTVTFAPGLPVTNSYLAAQPVAASTTLLNAGTPAYVQGQAAQYTLTTVSGDGGPEPAFPPAGPADPDYFLRDPYLVVRAATTEASLYANAEIILTADDGAQHSLTPFDDALVGIELSGSDYSETLPRRDPAAFPGVMTYAGGHHAGTPWGPALYATPYTVPDAAPSGLLGAVAYPSWPATGPDVYAAEGGLQRELYWVLDEHLTDAGPAPTDRAYASMGPATVSPSVTGAATGACWYGQEFAAAYTRAAPWTYVLADLAAASLMYGTSALQPEGIPVSGVGFTPVGGSVLPDPPAPVTGVLG